MVKLTALVMVFGVGVAHADSKSDAAANLVADADGLIASGKHVEACPKLEAALRLVPGEDTRVKLSDCYKVVVRSLLPSKQDHTACERLEVAAKGDPSEGTTIALVTCYKAHASVLLDVPDHARACERAEKAAAVLPTAANLANAGGCYIAAKKLGRAWALLLSAHAKATDARTQTDITELVATVSPARLVVIIPTGAVVTLDGAPVPATAIYDRERVLDAFGTAGYPVDAGKHVVEVTSNGQIFEEPVVAVDGNVLTITAKFAPAEPAPPPAVASSRKRIGWITIAASGVVGAAGLYFGYDALTKQNQADDACPTMVDCEPSAIELNTKANRSANVSNVMVGAALVGSVVGTVLVLTAPKETQLSVSASPSGGGVTLLRRF